MSFLMLFVVVFSTIGSLGGLALCIDGTRRLISEVVEEEQSARCK